MGEVSISADDVVRTIVWVMVLRDDVDNGAGRYGNMIIRKLTASDSEALWELITDIESTLVSRDFWLPIKETSKEHYFDDSWTEFYGAFDGDRLAGASALFYNSFEFGESLSKLGRDPEGVAEVGRSMVHPDYRGRNLLVDINKVLISVAREKGLTFLLATVHPDNAPSQASFNRLGFIKRTTYLKSDGFVRDIFTYDL